MSCLTTPQPDCSQNVWKLQLEKYHLKNKITVALTVPTVLQAVVANVPVHKGSGSYLRSLLPTSSFEHLSMGPHNHRHKKDHTQPFGRVATACVSSPRDWAVSMGSHMQQNTVISFGATTSGRTFFHFFEPFSTKSGEKKMR